MFREPPIRKKTSKLPRQRG